MICLKSLNELIKDVDTFITCRDDPMSSKFLANGFIASVPKHPFLKKMIDNIVDNVENLRVRYYLDISGPGLLGKSVNEICGRNEHGEFQLGINQINGHTFKVLKHDWQNKNFSYEDSPILITEYPNKNGEMDKVGNPSFYSLVQKGEIYQSIPFNIYYTSYDHLGINTYMFDSFKEKNKRWSMNHYTDDKCLNFFREKNNEFIELLGVDVLSYYLTLTNGGEKSDLWRYCVLFINGGVYTDTDTYCNVPLTNWVKHHDLILGIEAFLSIETAESFGADKIGFRYKDKKIADDIREIIITREELKIIRNLDKLNLELLAFAYLVYSKVYNIINSTDKSWVFTHPKEKHEPKVTHKGVDENGKIIPGTLTDMTISEGF
jgi:mannosyltransferase OCH1-like enzyme